MVKCVTPNPGVNSRYDSLCRYVTCFYTHILFVESLLLLVNRVLTRPENKTCVGLRKKTFPLGNMVTGTGYLMGEITRLR